MSVCKVDVKSDGRRMRGDAEGYMLERGMRVGVLPFYRQQKVYQHKCTKYVDT